MRPGLCAVRYEGTKVRMKYTPLVKLAALPTRTRPLLLGSRGLPSSGRPSFLVERLRGNTARFIFRDAHAHPGAFAELAPSARPTSSRAAG